DTSDIVSSIAGSLPQVRPEAIVYPTINRVGKGDRLLPGIPAPQAEPGRIDDSATPSVEPPAPITFRDRPKTSEIDHREDTLPDAPAVVLAEIARDAQRRNAPVKPDEIAAAMRFEPFPEYDISLSLELDPKISSDDSNDLADLDPTQFTPNAP